MGINTREILGTVTNYLLISYPLYLLASAETPSPLHLLATQMSLASMETIALSPALPQFLLLSALVPKPKPNTFWPSQKTGF